MVNSAIQAVSPGLMRLPQLRIKNLLEGELEVMYRNIRIANEAMVQNTRHEEKGFQVKNGTVSDTLMQICKLSSCHKRKSTKNSARMQRKTGGKGKFLLHPL